LSYFLDDDASQVRELKDKLEKLQSDILSTQFSVSQENVESGQSTFPIANPSARGGGTSGGGGSGLTEPLLHTITTVTPVTLPTKTDIDSSVTNVFKITLDKDIEFDITNPNATKFEMLHIVITQDATTARTITWPGSVNGIPSIDSTLGSETTVSLFNMGDGTWRYVSTKGGTINFAGASKALDNLITPILNTSINFNSHAPTNFNGYVSQIIGNTLVNDAIGTEWTLPTGDTYSWKIAGTQYFAITEVVAGLGIPLSMNSHKITNVTDPTANQDVATKKYVDDSVIAGSTFDDNIFVIQDEVDNTKQITFNASLLSTSSQALLNFATGPTRTYTFPALTGTIPLLELVQTFSAEQTFSSKIKFSTDGTLDFGDSTHYANQVFSEQITLRGISGPALSTTAYITSDTSNMIGNVPTGDEYVWKIANTTHMQWTRDTNGKLFIRSGAAKEMGFVVSTSNIVVGISGSIEIPVDGGSVGSAAAANTDFGDSVGCIGLYLNTIGSGNPTLCIKIDDGPGTDNRWSATTINRTTGALTGGILT